MTSRQEVCRGFASQSGWGDATWDMIAGDASNRKYYRLHQAGRTAVLMDAPPDAEEDVRPFIKIARFLTQCGLSAPEIFECDTTSGCLLLEDLGDDLFASLLARKAADEAELYRTSMDVLVHLHQQTPPALAEYDVRTMAELSSLALEWYAAQNVSKQERQDFTAALSALFSRLETKNPVLIQRDYHAQNLLWLPQRHGIRRVGLLDFQDARLGHPAYDVVSVLQDARRDVAPELEARMIRYFCERSGYVEAQFRADYAILGLQRNLRILGVFARLKLRDGKDGYVQLIPRVWEFVVRNLAHPDLAFLRPRVLEALPAPSAAHLEQLS